MYTKISKSERAKISKKYGLAQLISEGMGSFIQITAKLLIWMTSGALALLVCNMLSNDPIYITVMMYIGIGILLIGVPLYIICFSILIFSDWLIGLLMTTQVASRKSQNIIEPIDQIFTKIKYIHFIILVLYRMTQFLSLFSEKSIIEKIVIYLRTYTNSLIEFLANLRSDLQLRLAEQQKTLEQAKIEVEQNIHGTTELEQVSELQKARLDRQIEQFEELQRVLVKV